jgi:hypothetical protein
MRDQKKLNEPDRIVHAPAAPSSIVPSATPGMIARQFSRCVKYFRASSGGRPTLNLTSSTVVELPHAIQLAAA